MSKECIIKFADFFKMQEYEAALDTLSAGAAEPRILITETISLERLPDAFEEFRMRTYQCKVQVAPILAAAMAAAPLIARQGGTVTTVASMYAYFGAAARPGYAASKGAIMQLTKSLAQLLAKQGVRVNSVAPGLDRNSPGA